MSKQKVLTSFFVVFYSIYGIKKYILKFFGIFLKNLLILLTFYGNILYVMENIYK